MDEPREIDIDMLQCPEELLECLEDLQYKVEELQVYCQESEKKNEQMRQLLLDKERDFKKRIRQLTDDLSALRETKFRLVRENVMKECAIAPRWFNALTKSVEQEKKISELSNKVDDLDMEVMEKTKLISSLEWKLKDSEATIVVLTSDRNRLAVEVDEMALRLEEVEYAEHFCKKESERSRTETASFNSCDEEAMSYSDKLNGLHSRTSFQSEEESENFGPLKRAANFSNINALDESADFELEQSNIQNDASDLLPKNNANCSDLVSTEKNNNTLESLAKSPSQDRKSLENVEMKIENSGRATENLADNGGVLSVRKKDTSWEKFDRLDSSLNLSKRIVDNGEKTPVLIENCFEKENSPFSQILVSTPLRREIDLDKEDNGKASFTKGESPKVEDPWVSPAVSPMVEKKNKESFSRNLFWEKNNDCNIYPFYLADESEDEESIGEDNHVGDNSKKEAVSLGQEDEFFRYLEPFKENADKVSGSSLPSNFSFDEKMISFEDNEDNKKTNHIIVKKASKDNLWDFEPDSIVDVSTGQTIYESLREGEAQDATEEFDNKTDIHLNADSEKTPITLKLDERQKDIAESPDHMRSVSDSSTDSSRSREKNWKADDGRNCGDANSPNHKKEFVKKGPKKERAALQAYMQWKVQGKQGMPPANFKISLC